MANDLKNEFWDRLEDTRTGMLAANGAPAVPMSHYSDDDKNIIWFITAKGTDLAQSAARSVESQYIVCSNDESLYARVDGTQSGAQLPVRGLRRENRTKMSSCSALYPNRPKSGRREEH